MKEFHHLEDSHDTSDLPPSWADTAVLWVIIIAFGLGLLFDVIRL